MEIVSLRSKDVKEVYDSLNHYFKLDCRKFKYDNIFTALQNDQMCGYFVVEKNMEETILIHIYVKPLFRKKGIAYKMLDYMFEVYKGHKIQTVLDDNALLIFFIKKGFFIDEIFDRMFLISN